MLEHPEQREGEPQVNEATMMLELQKKQSDLYDLTNVIMGRKIDEEPSLEKRKQFFDLLRTELPALNDKLTKLLNTGKEIAGL